MGIFSKVQDYVGSQKTNVFDLSFTNNLTLPIGGLVPCCVKEVVNGDKFRIRARFGFNFMPTFFPIQSTLKIDCQFFYVRNRNLWNRWTDYQFNPDPSTDSELVPPYYSTTIRNDFQPGTLLDYMGVPVVYPAEFLSNMKSQYTQSSLSNKEVRQFLLQSTRDVNDYSDSGFYYGSNSIRPVEGIGTIVYGSLFQLSPWINSNTTFMSFADHPSIHTKTNLSLIVSSTITSFDLSAYTIYYFSDGVLQTYKFLPDDVGKTLTISVDNVFRDSTSGAQVVPPSGFGAFILLSKSSTSSGQISSPFSVNVSVDLDSTPKDSIPSNTLVNPLVNSSTGMRLSALPFRAYESIYNAFYRDERVNPLTDSDGRPVYNKWLLDDGGGVLNSSTAGTLHYRNWELDPYTSAQLSPQQGVAPLVGVTSLGDMQFASSDGKTYTVRPNLAEDGTTVVNAEMSSDIPSDVRRSFINLATSGISINDFRNVNSFQRWLETNMRRGFKYRDQIIAHTGIKPRFDVLDMPEFIGGFSTIVNSTKVNQTSESTPENPLGSYAGQMSAFANSEHDITVNCDENGFIIGIVCVYPVPTYSTLLPPFYSYQSPLDYYNQEFSHIGMQPIYNYMVAPSLAVGSSLSDIWAKNSKVFGYQRAWWQYLSSTDETHGEFLTTFKDFLFRRDFANQPSLSPDFTVINPDELTNPFSVRDTEHKVLGQIAFDIKAIRPIPKFGIPRLE